MRLGFRSFRANLLVLNGDLGRKIAENGRRTQLYIECYRLNVCVRVCGLSKIGREMIVVHLRICVQSPHRSHFVFITFVFVLRAHTYYYYVR